MTSDLDRRRLVQLLGMIGSNHDGEALNAARLADRHMRDHRMSREEIVLPPQPDCTEAYTRGFSDGLRACLENVKPPPWRKMVRRCLEELDLTPKERAFLRSLQRWHGAITPKQEKWLRDIYARVLVISAPGGFSRQ